MKTKHYLASLLGAAFLLSHAPLSAQTAEPLDAAAAKAALSQKSVKPRFIPKSPILSRTYTLTAKGAGVEIVQYANGQKEENPYVAIPILFVRGQDALLDTTSSANVRATAKVLLDIMNAEPGARFVIQGHTSAEGDAKLNEVLSAQRAQKIYNLLVGEQGVDATRLGQVGFGPRFAATPADGAESARQLDRRVLVVRQ